MSPKTTRREFLKGAAVLGSGALLAACAPAATPKPAEPTAKPGEPTAKPEEPTKAPEPTKPPEEVPMEVPRNRTLVTSFQGSEGKWVAPELWNPYALGTTHQDGLQVIYEPLAFYSAFADKEILWLAESYAFNDDFTELVIKTRSGINWSDGEPFSAEDVAYTIDTLRQLGAEVMWGTEMATFVESAEATDANTCVVKFNVPSARLFYFMTYKYDIGVPMVPKHIFEGQDWPTFTNLDIEKGWPVSTGPWKVVESTPEQRVYEPVEPREEWWAYKQGLAPQPMQIDRWVYIPRILDYTIGVETMVANEIDWLLFDDPLPAKRATEESPTIMTHAGKDSPYGYEDWWPLSVWINNTVEPFDQTDVRWALSYYTDREAVVEIGQAGIGWPHPVPMPDYPGLRKYVDGIEDILAEMNPVEYNPEKAEALLTGAGFTMDGDGNWLKPDGEPFTVLIEGWAGAAGRGTVIAELWNQAGIATEYAQPPDAWPRYTTGDYEMFIAGHGGSIARDPYDTLKIYQARSTAIPGIHAVNFGKWAEHPEYDALVDEMWVTDPDDIDTIMEIWRKAYTIWLTDLPEIILGAFFHHIVYNEKYWKGWPTKDDPYINEAIQHFTWQLVLNRLTPTE